MRQQITFNTESAARDYQAAMQPVQGIRFDVVMKPDCKFVLVGISGQEYVGTLWRNLMTDKRMLVS